jgi:pimeloyl-ACP methyl ester carboxylesterase/transcriptional regulator with XRE-family HTH domain
VSEPAGPAGPGAFAVRLRRLREAAALTQEELATRAGLTVKAVGALERGERRRPYPHTLRALADALGLDEPGRTQLVEAARTAAPEPPAAGPPTTAAPATDLVPVAPLLGRDAEVAGLTIRLRTPGTRLLTITGPGGVGKTSLARAAAAAVADDFPGGVALVELAAVREVSLVLPTVGRVLGLTQLGPTDVLEALAGLVGDRRRLIVLDNLEHLLDAAADLAALLDALGLERPHVAGMSFGGTLALELQRRHPGIASTLVLASAYAGWAGSLPPQETERRLRQALELADRSPEELVGALAPTMFSRSAPPELADRFLASLLRFHPAGLRAMACSSAEADLRDALPGIDVPTLLLYGDSDSRAPLEVADHLHAAIRHSRLVVLPGVGHLCNLEAPARFNSEVRSFLRAAQDPSP